VTVAKAAANRKANGCLARPDRRIALPQVLATVGFNRSERSASRAQCHTNRTVIKNKLHRSLPFRTPARQVNRADRKPARAPSQKREPSIKKLQNAGYRQNEASKLSKQTCYRSSSPNQNTSQQQGRSHRSLKRQRAAIRCPRSPRKRSDAYFMYASDGLSGEMGCLGGAQRRPVTRFGKTA